MKRTASFFLLLATFSVSAQFNPSAPWMKSNATARNRQPTIDQLVSSFNDYWKLHDKNVKGSGYKPFMRWENHWRNLSNEQGYLIKPQEFWNIWLQKNQAKSNQTGKSAQGLAASNWTPLGPFTNTNTGSWSTGQGRVNVVCVDPSNEKTIYVGSPAGGIWKSVDAGANWTPLSDNLPQIGVSGIAVDHSDPKTIYIATGDKDSSDTYSVGVLKSTDGGVTWKTTGLSFGNAYSLAGDLIMHPTNNQILWCATNIGLYKTSDGGTTWKVTQGGDFAQGSIRLKPTDATTVYAVSQDKFFRSNDSGDTFTVVTTGLPASSTRLLLDVTPANPEYVYVLSAVKPIEEDKTATPPVEANSGFQGIYRSTNGGLSFTKKSATTDVFESDQSWYDLAFAVSSTDADEIYTGCLNIWKSSNGGQTITRVNEWSKPSTASYTHGDIHFLQFFGNKLYAGTDGGIYVSSNKGANFSNLTAGLQISQFYRIAVSKQSSGKMVGGLQDNGGQAYSDNKWKNYYGADGMDTAIDPNNSNKYYGFIQNGSSLYISDNAGGTRSSHVGSPDDIEGNWVTPLTVNSAGELYAGYADLYKLNGTAWSKQSTTSLGEGNIDLISIDPSNDNTMFVANGKTLYKSVNKGVSFTTAYTAASNIKSICVHSADSNIIYITTSGTSGQALKSTNGGTSFTSFSTGLPAIGKNVIKHQGRHLLNPLYIGTSLGVYYRDDSMAQWEPFGANLPNVSVTDLEINLEDSKITAATYGRGVWQSAIPVEIPQNDLKLVSIQYPVTEINCGSVAPKISVKNNGVNVINAVTINYQYNGTPLNFVWNGTIAPEATVMIDLPQISALKGIYLLKVSATTANDAYPDNNESTVRIYVNDEETAGETNTFETATSSLLTYTEGMATSQWQRGVRSGGLLATGTNNVYATNLTANYPDKTKAYLISQCYNLSKATNPVIRFKAAFDLEENWDVFYVQYSTNSGQTWSVLGTKGANWYNSNRTHASSGTADDCHNCPGAQWTGTSTTLKEYSCSLNNLIGQSNVIFRIVFQSDDAENKQGVVIDDFTIDGIVATAQNDLKLVNIQYPVAEINCGSIVPKISVKNNGVNVINAVSVNYQYNGTPLNFVWNGTIVSGTTATIDLPQINAPKGIYILKITATTANDANLNNNESTVRIYVNDEETGGATNTFETSTSDLLTYTEGLATSQWQRGIRTGGLLATGTNNVYTTNLTGNYPDKTNAYLISQCYNLSKATSPAIRFKAAFDLDENRDVVYVQYSTNFGQTWNVLGTKGANWYNSDRSHTSNGIVDDCQNCPGAQWTGSSTTLKEYSCLLNDLIGQSNVIFRIVFQSDDAENKQGVVIDDFAIDGIVSTPPSETKNITTYPNPSNGIFNIVVDNIVPKTIEVFDLTGKMIYSRKDFKNNRKEVSIDLSAVPNGIYFIKITAENQTVAKRIIKI